MFYHALYQQGPIDEVSAFTNVSWLKQTTAVMSDDFKWARCWDLAATDGAGDWTTGSLCGYSRKTSNFIIANIVRRQLSPGLVEQLVRNTAVSDGTDTEILIEQEPGSSGKNLIEHFQKAVLPEYTVTAVPAVKSKLIRAQPCLAAAEAGKVWLLDETITQELGSQGAWQDHFMREFETFPSGQYDDQVDTMSAGYNYLSGKKILSASWGRRKDDGTNKRNSKQIRKASFMIGTTNRTRSIAWGRNADDARRRNTR
jgi:predicted phage terminase large subunit-like protein